MKETGKQLLRNKRVTVIGMSVSGIAAARLARACGAGSVRISEYADSPGLRTAAVGLERRGIRTELGGHSALFLAGTDLIITSPGVKPQAIPLVWARRRSVPIISELELASWFCPCPVIAVTGSNGKTTVTTLIGRLLQTSEQRIAVCGNIGIPLSAVLLGRRQPDIAVCEVSSFQLEYAWSFAPAVSVVLNLTQNHLDHHRSLREYRQAKARMVLNQGARDVTVLNYDDPWVRRLGARSPARVLFFAAGEHDFKAAASRCGGAAWIEDERLVFKSSRRKERNISLEKLRLPGSHNRANVLAAVLAVRRWQLGPVALQQTIDRFRGVEHRCELVARCNGVTYINDAKSTTVDATAKALELFADNSVILICGGRNKGSDFRPLQPLIGRKAARVIAIGEAAADMCRIFSSQTRVNRAATLPAAVRQARQQADPGMTVLLSPMCASFDMFTNYKHRGAVYKKTVKQEIKRS